MVRGEKAGSQEVLKIMGAGDDWPCGNARIITSNLEREEKELQPFLSLVLRPLSKCHFISLFLSMAFLLVPA